MSISQEIQKSIAVGDEVISLLRGKGKVVAVKIRIYKGQKVSSLVGIQFESASKILPYLGADPVPVVSYYSESDINKGYL